VHHRRPLWIAVHLLLDQRGERAEPVGRYDRPGQVGEHPPAGRHAEAGGVGRAAGRVGQQVGQHLGDDLGHRGRRPAPRIAGRALDPDGDLVADHAAHAHRSGAGAGPPAHREGEAARPGGADRGGGQPGQPAGGGRRGQHPYLGRDAGQVGGPVTGDHPDRQVPTEPGERLGDGQRCRPDDRRAVDRRWCPAVVFAERAGSVPRVLPLQCHRSSLPGDIGGLRYPCPRLCMLEPDHPIFHAVGPVRHMIVTSG
jgi:hypothetical protein